MSGLILTSPFKSKGFSVHVSVTGGTLGSLVPGCSVAPLSIIGSLASVLESEHQGVKVCVVLTVNSKPPMFFPSPHFALVLVWGHF